MTTETFDKLEQAKVALNGIDLRTLRGEARDKVKEARASVAAATTAVRAAQSAALIGA